MNINFSPLKESDFPFILQWLESPHVKKWWDQDMIYTMDLVKEKFGQHLHGIAISKDLKELTYAYIIAVDTKKIGYIQAYNARAYADENGLDLSSIQGAICGVDVFIGEKKYLHKGYGSIILEEFADQILYSHFNYGLIDPSTNNQRAIRAFEKAGFKVVNQFQTNETTWMIKKLNPSGV